MSAIAIYADAAAEFVTAIVRQRHALAVEGGADHVPQVFARVVASELSPSSSVRTSKSRASSSEISASEPRMRYVSSAASPPDLG